MLSVLIFLIIIIFKADASGPDNENPEIRLSCTDSKKENYTVLKDKPLKIIIENCYARYIWCSSYGVLYRKFVPETEFSNDIINKLNITYVTAEMSTRWKCKVLQQYHGPVLYTYKRNNYTAKDLHFSLHVKGAKAVILTANNQSLTYVTTNLSVNHDGEANYTYEDGEDFPMDFSCKKAETTRNLDTLRLEYYNPEDAVQHEVILSVNGQKLRKSFNKDKSYDDYIFRYIDGEVLNVTCRKMNVSRRGTLTFLYDKEIVHLMSKILRSPLEEVISLNISASNIKDKSLTCCINNTHVEKTNARLVFLSDVPDNDVRIRGLPRNNILYQYTNNEDQWTIEYQYSVNDTLNLTCVSKGVFHVSQKEHLSPYPFEWKFEGKTNDSAAIEIPSTPIKFSKILFTKILDATHNGTKIKCIYFPIAMHDLTKTVEIILRLKPEFVLEPRRNDDPSGETLLYSTHSYTLIYCLTAAGISVIIILVVLYWAVKKSCCCKRSSSQELPPVPAPRRNPQTAYYENLLTVFQPINEREAAAELENHYEKIL